MYLLGQKLAPTTVHKRLQFARMFFRAAKHRKLIDRSIRSPKSRRKAAMRPDRQRFVTREETDRLLAAANPDVAHDHRPGPLRRPALPSEVLSVRWSDVEWDAVTDRGEIAEDGAPRGQGQPRDSALPGTRPILDEAYGLQRTERSTSWTNDRERARTARRLAELQPADAIRADRQTGRA